MTYPFVHATEDYGLRKGPVLAFVVHMAEGGGTVGFLSKPDVVRGVSVHYVIEYTGRIVQMLLETHASGSINPADIRTTDDADGFYGATTAKAVLGSWWKDPNSAVISVEIEGFAASGPNAAQHGSLRTLVDDVRSRYPQIGLLGHRDFADYKACPGRLIHWDDLGGHGAAEDSVLTTITVLPNGGGTFRFNVPLTAFKLADDGTIGPRATLQPAAYAGGLGYDASITTTATRGGPFLRIHAPGSQYDGFLVAASQVAATPNPVTDCTQQVADARAAGYEDARTKALAAVGGI